MIYNILLIFSGLYLAYCNILPQKGRLYADEVDIKNIPILLRAAGIITGLWYGISNLLEILEVFPQNSAWIKINWFVSMILIVSLCIMFVSYKKSVGKGAANGS